MIRNPKALGLVLGVMLAVSALVATAASATAVNFTLGGPSTTITGAQVGTDVFQAAGKEVKCAEANYHGSTSEITISTVAITPFYEECSVAGVIGAIDMMSCRYVFHAGTETAEGLEGVVDIECSNPADAITIHSALFGTPKCTITAGPQNGIPGSIDWTNGTAPSGKSDVTVDVSLKEIEYTSHEKTAAGVKMSGFAACTQFGERTDGTYVGSTTVEGTFAPSGDPIDIAVD